MINAKQARSARVSVVLWVAAFLLPAIAHAAENRYHVLTTYKLTGPGKPGNVRVDSEARRLYVTHGDRVDVLNADTGASVGTVPAKGSNDIVLAPGLKHGFISNGSAASVMMFDPATLKVMKTIKLDAQNPDALEYDEDVNRVFVTTASGVTAIDANLGQVAGNVALEGRLRRLVSNHYGRLF